MADLRPWKLVAPWYRWKRQIDAGVATSARDTLPVIQKFNQSDFVPGFLAQPQHSLKFQEAVDQIFTVSFVPAKLTSGPFAGKLSSLFPADADGDTSNPQKVTLVPQGIRKIFLDTHKRYYLVVCELHCDAPGFPTALPTEVCQAGLVVRRRLLQYPAAAQKPALAILRQIVGIEAQIAELDQTAPVRPMLAQRRALKIQKMVAEGTFMPARQALSDKLAAKRAELHEWKDANGVFSVQEGWVPGAFDKIGSWQIVDDAPTDVIAESYAPIFPVFANPQIPDHDAKGYTIYFGVLPTSSHDTDPTGLSQYDDQSTYEARCFVRHHDPSCPRTQQVPDCHGTVYWSLPTAIYRLAPQFDLDGTSNRPVTINLPNLAELAAQVAAKPFGQLSPMKFVQPQSLKPQISGTSLSGGSMGIGQICFFAIPLITIVAFFVLNLFLPIIVFLFGLWFLLVLKFCIPPSISVSAGLQAELSATAPKLDAQLDASFTVSVGPPISALMTETQIHTDFAAAATALISQQDVSPPPPLPDFTSYSNSALRPMATAAGAEAQMPSTDDGPTPIGLNLTQGLEYETRVTVRPVIP